MELSNIAMILSLVLFHVTIAIVLASSQLGFATTLVKEGDRQALLAFKAQVSDPSGVLSSWNDTLHFCQWEGVTCSKRHQRVVALDLEAKGLAGTLSPSVGNLSFLHEINFGSNNLRGQIPQELGNLFRLQVLNLSLNSFEGEIPVNLSSCKNLKLLNLNNNNLIGKLPAELGFNKNLKILLVASNNLTGSIPTSFGNLSSLQYLVLMINNLEGSIPHELGQLTYLNWLQLAGNKLTGELPSSLHNLTSITLLSVAGNELHGSLPTSIGLSFPNLQWLSIGGNYFTGVIPVSLSNATKLLLLDVSQNELTGTVPEKIGNLQSFQHLNVGFNHLGSGRANDLNFLTSLTNCSNLQVLGLNDNNFGGLLPNSIANLSSQLQTLTLGRNKLTGRILSGIENLINLNTLGLEGNALNGTIPSGIGKLQNLQLLDLSRNKLSGQIPPSLGNITIVIQLLLDGNNLEGYIPKTLSNCQQLQVLNLSQNDLNGSIPWEILNLPFLSIYFNLANNSLSGPLPPEVGNLKHLVELDISNNLLSGEIPDNLGNCLGLEKLYMHNNFFDETIPSSMSSLKSLQILDLSHNNLTGNIPVYFEKFPLLHYLDLSFNNLEGEVPMEGIFDNATAISVTGNSKLCGGIPAFQLTECPAQPPRKHKGVRSLKLLVLVTLVVTSAVVIIIAIIFYLRFRRRHVPTSPLTDDGSSLSYWKLFKATEEFSPANLIGKGSYGSVFRGVLDGHEKEVAIKVMNLQNQGASKSFVTECKALRNIRHRNLVKIITSCSSVDHRGNEFKALVYEFMPNGSLEKWLHSEEQGPHRRHLSFMQRLDIAIDVALALEYLHCYCQTPIVHSDLKPSNVLLDNDMTGHLSDFGLASLLADTTNTSSSSQSSLNCIKGTTGYVAPEHGLGSVVSVYSDVYSYGILLLEMFTGKRPTDDMFKNNLTLHEYAKAGLAEPSLKIEDPILFQEQERDNGDVYPEAKENSGITDSNSCGRNTWRECLVMVIEIGVKCSMESLRDRPHLRTVAKEMQAIKDHFHQFYNIRHAL